MNPTEHSLELKQASVILKVMANPERLLLLCSMLEQEKNVTELEQELDIHQPTLSQQLTVLKKHELVDVRREGKYMYYRLKNEHVRAIIRTLHQEFCYARTL